MQWVYLRSSWQFAMHLILGVCFVPLGFCDSKLMAQYDTLAANQAVFGCNAEAERLLVIRRHGNRAGRNAEVAVVEIVDPQKRLRVLHQLETLCPGGLWVASLSRCGRFFLTMDETSGVGVSDRDLVIYDLVRKEHSNYGIRDFLSSETVASLKPHSFLPGVEWCRTGAFDYQRMEYYPTIPSESRRLQLPFVVVDLLTRQAREEPVPDREIETGWSSTDFPNGHWLCSMGDQPLPGADEPLRLPAFLRVEYGEEGKRQRRVFRLDQETGDYLAVPEHDWPDERLPLITAGMYREAESERGVQRRE